MNGIERLYTFLKSKIKKYRKIYCPQMIPLKDLPSKNVTGGSFLYIQHV